VTDDTPAKIDPALDALELALGHRFRRRELLVMALTHRSHAHESVQGSATPATHYERLEFLGDALLGFLVADRLYADDPRATEGVLSRRRQLIVRTATLAEAARRLGLGELLRLGRGEQLTGGREKPSLLADVLESLLGAVYVDGGVRAARAVARRLLAEPLRESRRSTEALDDYKTRLQERIQAELQRTPSYRIVSTSGPPHALVFAVEAELEGRVLAAGTGPTRKHAEQDAARRALLALDTRDTPETPESQETTEPE
jgi:ribonuclease-3